jgi:pimeloyl-ACP methyl ester carboxylesterase
MQYEKHHYQGSQGQLESWYIPRAGSSKVVLLFHGYVRNKATLLNEACIFHKLGYACLMVDFPGSGDSKGSHTSIGYNESNDVLSSLNYAREVWPQKRQILFGFSMGAAAILRAAKLHHLEVDKIILESPFTTLLETVGARFKAMGIPPYPLAHLLVFWGSVRLGYNGFTFNPIKYAKDLKSPVLQMHGTLDRRVPLVRALELHQNIRVEKTFVEFEGCGHESLATKEPEKWRITVDNFLSDAEQAPLRKAA